MGSIYILAPGRANVRGVPGEGVNWVVGGGIGIRLRVNVAQ